jgi:ankyrin repeat protein
MDPSDRLLDAVKAGDVDAVARLLDEDRALVDARFDGVSAMLVALYHRRPGVAALFAARRHLDVHEMAALGRGADLREFLRRAPDEAQRAAVDGFTPLGLASFFGHEEAARILLDFGADPRRPSRNEMRVAPLHSAVARRSLGVARLLLDRGADVNARQAGGFTPLHGAAADGDRAMAELLVERGGDPAVRDEGGRTPAEIATTGGHDALADWLAGLLGG